MIHRQRMDLPTNLSIRFWKIKEKKRENNSFILCVDLSFAF